MTSDKPWSFGMDAGVVAAARNVAAFASLKAASTFDADVDRALNEYAEVR